MKKKALNREIKKCFLKSKGRFFSILCLVALGSFALVGLQVAGPDMRRTGETYFEELKSADISVIGDYGIDSENQSAINRVSGAEKIEYGYLKDAVIAKTDKSIRIFSQTDGISEYELIEGKMPKTADEIAVASFLSDEYSLGDTIEFCEKENIDGSTALKNHRFKIVGFVNSSELLSIINMGQSTAGTGELQGYAVVTKDAFDSSVYMIARLSFSDTQGVDPYSEEYRNLIENHKNELNSLLKNQPSQRLASIKSEYQAKIDDAQQEIDDGRRQLDDAHAELVDGEHKLADAKKKYSDGLSEYKSKKSAADKQLTNAQKQIDSSALQIAAAQKELNSKRQELQKSEGELASARNTLDTKQAEYNSAATKIEELKQTEKALRNAQSELDEKIATAEKQTGMTIEEIEKNLPSLKQTLPTSQYEELLSLVNAKNELQQKWAEYNSVAEQYADAEKQLSAAKLELEKGETEYAVKENEISAAKAKIASAQTEIDEKNRQLTDARNTLTLKRNEANHELAAAKTELDSAAAQISESETKLADGWDEYNIKKADADIEISDAEVKVAKAQRMLDRLKQPVYALDTRREIPGSEGYRIYASVSEIIDSLADIFPIFLYFVAALVTLTTMTRFVDEERINSGTLKALGYDNRDIIKKFTLYGLCAGMSGAVIGIAAGHTILPMIVYNAYGKSFTYPKIELHFYPWISLVAIVLALFCTVVPALVVASKELRERPSALLMPKPPEAGSKILLERIRPLWTRMNFTHKVTARNLFRYKKRMLMTIFGVCGSVTLIFAGFSVQHSISGVKDRQFGDIMKYDLIVAKNDGIDEEQSDEIHSLLSSDDVKSQIEIHYETVSKAAGKNNDEQQIKLIVPSETDKISNYIMLASRSSHEPLTLSDDGCIVSERFAKLIGAKVGDSFEFSDENKNTVSVKIDGITEMYTGHFIFMNKACYESAFSTKFTSNAHLVTLNDRSESNAKLQASKFIELDGVKGVVQNTTLTNQIDTIVHSLNRIMQILIIVAVMLAVVILYNLTNINVSERIRELSTIKVLGFYDNEVTMYIYRETLILTVIGILTGFVFGDALFRYIINIVPPDEVMFNPSLGAKAFVIPAVVISVITVLLGLTVNRRLKKVDMLEALKSVD